MGTFEYILRTLLQASVFTISVTVGALIVAVLGGFALTLFRSFFGKVANTIVLAYVELFRNSPVLVQLFVIYFGLGQIGIRLEPTTAAIIGLGMNGAAILSEVFRSALRSVDKGQTEAALAIGLTPARALFTIVLPQATRLALPAMGSYAVGLVKDTSLASAVAVPELAFRARNLVSETYLSTQIYLLVALIYFVMSYPFSKLVLQLEKRYAKGGLKHG